MYRKLFLKSFVLFLSLNSFGQVEELTKHSNFFGVSFDIGGGLEIDSSKYYSRSLTPSKNPNIGVSLFWEHNWYFHNNHGLIVGGGVNWMTFSNSVDYEYSVNWGPDKAIKDKLGEGLRNSVFSIDLPVYYTYRFKTEMGAFNPYIGVTARTVAGLVGQNGYSGETSGVEYQGSEYFSRCSYRFDLNQVAPIVQPTVGLSYVRKLKNGASLKYSVDYKLFLNTSNFVSANYENNFRQKGGYMLNSDGELVPVESIPVEWTYDNLKVNMSRLSLGISYSFK